MNEQDRKLLTAQALLHEMLGNYHLKLYFTDPVRFKEYVDRVAHFLEEKRDETLSTR